jgi:DNA-3-methyladenine glycosylase
MPAKLPRSFYSRPALDVANDLLGKVLVRRIGRKNLSGKIVETEAYIGPHDLACHASKGHTPRTSVMFGPPGYAYVYMIYGFYFCLNVVTEPPGYPAAVLIRAVEPLDNVGLMRKLRKNPERETNITSGPGKLCMAMSIDKQLNGADLLGTAIWIEDRSLDAGNIRTSPRVGVDYAGEFKDKPWRFFVEGHPYVSRVRFK